MGSGKTEYEMMQLRYDQTMDELRTFLPHYRELAKYLQPRLGKWLTGSGNTVNVRNDGSKKNAAIVNETGTLALNSLISFMRSGIVSPTQRWFRYTLENKALLEEPGVRDFLAMLEREVYSIFSRSNFYNASERFFAEQATFCTAAMNIERDPDTVIRCRTYTAGQYSMEMDHRGVLNRFVLKYPMTVEQMVDRFGTEGKYRVSAQVQRDYDNGDIQKTVVVNQMWEPNDDRMTLPELDARLDVSLKLEGFEWRAVTWDPGDQKKESLLEVIGYPEMPNLAARWDVLGDDTFGFGPSMDALGSIKGLQSLERKIATQIELVGKPPILGNATSGKGKRANIIPGGFTFGQMQGNAPAYQPLFEVRPDLQGLYQERQQIEDRIRKLLLSDHFFGATNYDGGPRTAREIEELHQEKLQRLGPVMEQDINEFLDPLHKRVLSILFRETDAGGELIMPPTPEALQDNELEIEYVSAIAQSQKAVQVLGMQRWIEFGQGLVAATGEVTAFDKVKQHQMMDEVGDLIGVPPEVIEDDETADGKAQARAQAQQRAQALDAGVQMSGAAKDLGQASTGEGTALNSVMEQLGAQQ